LQLHKGDKMDKLTQEQLNGLSPRARKAYEDKHGVISEILTINPNKEEVEIDVDDSIEEDE
tara:strand:- start:859 stop:1041 length:183 start_codon:yes stop_codon:yes gene_type:complete